MKGLLIKDSYILLREAKVFLLIVVMFCIIRNGFTQGFAIMYASMLPFTALSYDEQAKWDYLAEMMPYRRRDLVLSKYIIGILATLIVGVLQTVSTLAAQVFRPDGLLTDHLVSILIYVCCGLLLMAVNLPVLFKLGSEKGRMVYLLITVCVAVAVVSSVTVDAPIWNLPFVVYPVAGVLLAVIGQMVSVPLSVKFYTARRV